MCARMLPKVGKLLNMKQFLIMKSGTALNKMSIFIPTLYTTHSKVANKTRFLSNNLSFL